MLLIIWHRWPIVKGTMFAHLHANCVHCCTQTHRRGASPLCPILLSRPALPMGHMSNGLPILPKDGQARADKQLQSDNQRGASVQCSSQSHTADFTIAQPFVPKHRHKKAKQTNTRKPRGGLLVHLGLGSWTTEIRNTRSTAQSLCLSPYTSADDLQLSTATAKHTTTLCRTINGCV